MRWMGTAFLEFACCILHVGWAGSTHKGVPSRDEINLNIFHHL
jgi:hypothetical protein